LKYLFLRIFFISICFFAPGRCSTEQEIDPSIAFVLKEFVEDAKERGITINTRIISSAKIVDINDPFVPLAIGMCHPFIFFAPFELPRSSKVRISSKLEAWKYPYTFKALVYHELAHCLLYYDHTPESDRMNLMNPTLGLDEWEYKENWNLLVDKLFAPDYPAGPLFSPIKF
jgi:hypothetical protein